MPSTLVSELPKHDVVPTRWTDAALDRMRGIADPETDPLALELFEREGPRGLTGMTRVLEDWEAPVPGHLPERMREWFAAPVDFPAFVDPVKRRSSSSLTGRCRPSCS
jgi:hypothetical protein